MKMKIARNKGFRNFKFGNPDKGYNRKGFSWKESIKRYKKTGVFKTVSGGSGHEAGYRWGNAKNIDPQSMVRRYSKNSPSFDEGVRLSKDSRRLKRAVEIEKKLAKLTVDML